MRKSTDTNEVLLELSDMFSTSTSNPIGHSSVFTAYLQTSNSLAVAALTWKSTRTLSSAVWSANRIEAAKGLADG